MRRPHSWVTGVLGAILMTAACGGGSTPPPANSGAPPSSSNPTNVSLDKNSYPVFPNADAGADPSVPAEQGGRGSRAKGGRPTRLRSGRRSTRRQGRRASGSRFRFSWHASALRARIKYLASITRNRDRSLYEPLLCSASDDARIYSGARHALADFRRTRLNYRFRLNPNARWSDGQPVVADDVVATWKSRDGQGLQDPSAQLVYDKFEQPVAESKYIVSVKSKQLNWRNFLYFAQTHVHPPGHVLKHCRRRPLPQGIQLQDCCREPGPTPSTKAMS